MSLRLMVVLEAFEARPLLTRLALGEELRCSTQTAWWYVRELLELGLIYEYAPLFSRGHNGRGRRVRGAVYALTQAGVVELVRSRMAVAA